MTDTTTTATLTDEQTEYVQGLRDLADFLADRPDLIPPPYSGANLYRFVGEGHDGTPAEQVKGRVGQLARLMGSAGKDADGNWFNINRTFGPHVLQVTALRADVCERVVIGTETVEVEEPDPEQVAALPKVKRTETVEKVEWVCPPSILRAADEPASS